ncbi:MAG: DUF975 family protein [Clostridium butyricum]|nr:DUF975 family protein [Clostridium butyricum]
MNDRIIYSDLKRSALDNLKGHWGLAIGVFLIGMIITTVFSGFEEMASKFLIHSNKEVFKIVILVIVFGIITSLIETIINYGLSNFSLNLISNDKEASLEDLFKGVLSFSRIIPIWLIQGICIGALLLPFSLSEALKKDYSGSSINIGYSYNFLAEGILLVIGIFTIILHLLLSAYISQAYYICIESPTKPTIECIKESFRMMKGHVSDYILLNLSFIGWGILAIFTCGIGFLWLMPYMEVTLAKFHEKVQGIFYRNNANPIY